MQPWNATRADNLAHDGDLLTPPPDAGTPSQPARIALMAGAAGLAAALAISKFRRSS